MEDIGLYKVCSLQIQLLLNSRETDFFISLCWLQNKAQRMLSSKAWFYCTTRIVFAKDHLEQPPIWQ